MGLRLAGLGLEFSGSVIGGLALGHFLDRWLGTEPWLFLLGTFGGLGAAMVRLVQVARVFDAAVRRRAEEGGDRDRRKPTS